MNIQKAYIEAIAKTLPIGYYAKRRIPLTISEADDTSWYNPSTDELCISLGQIQGAFEAIKEDNISEEQKEELVRSNLYHEVSHAILTPDINRGYYSKKPITPQFNIFEDERIETKFSDFYLNIDFVKNKYLTNGLEQGEPIPQSTTAIQEFYKICRFHQGKKKFTDKFWELYEKYKDLTANADFWLARQYEKDVDDFFKEVEKDFIANGGSASVEGETPNIPIDIKGNGKGNNGKDGEEGEGEGEENASEECSGNHPHKAQAVEAFHRVLDRLHDDTMTNQFEEIIANFNKRNSGGSSVTGYSGIINPRLMSNNDYRIFERKSSVQGSNKYGSCHLNLFIDTSGSFCNNEEIVNKMLTSLSAIERKYNFFSFDLVYCNCGQTIADKSKKMITCNGGNHLSKDIYNQYRSLQKTGTCNYNIVLFDGDANPDRVNGDYVFKAFDHPNCLIISDYDNRSYMKNIKTTKPIYTRNYASELLDNVLKALKVAFR